jgi:hypothetical protein
MSKRRKIHQTVFQDWETGVPKTSTTSGAYRSFKCSSPLFSVYIDLGLFLREKRMDINLQYKELSEIGSFFSLLFMNVNKSQNVIGRCFITSHLFPSSPLLSLFLIPKFQPLLKFSLVLHVLYLSSQLEIKHEMVQIHGNTSPELIVESFEIYREFDVVTHAHGYGLYSSQLEYSNHFH